MTRYLLALDQGTTSSRAILFDQHGRIKAQAQREIAQHYPQPGWVEHDPDEIWATQAATIAEALALADASPEQLVAVGIANQRETTVLWDRATGRPLAPAIVWQDRRTADYCDRLRTDGHEAEISRRTGLLLDPYFSATKLAWLFEHIDGSLARAERGELAFGTIDSWLAYKLSEHRLHVTDVTNASRTQLLNLSTGEWDQTMLDLFGIPRACLPSLLPSSIPTDTCVGSEPVTARIQGHEVPLAGIAGDQQAALFGQACFERGMAKNTYGTGCFMLMNTGTSPIQSRHRLLSTIAWDIGRRNYAIEGSVFVGGAVVQWLRDELRFIDRSEDVESLAGSVPDSGGAHVVPAFTGLGSPYWDPHARGTITGLTRGTGKAHIARAALEAIAFQSAELLAAIQGDAGQPLLELRVDGGACVNDLLMQFQADLLGVLVVRPRIRETTALGAAFLAGLATGYWSSLKEISRIWQQDRSFEPVMSRDEAATRLAGWSAAVRRSRGLAV